MNHKEHSILLTVDVEDWFQVENFKGYIKRSEWENLPARVVQNTIMLLDLFQKSKTPVKATFFVLGWVAEKFPDLIREICRQGHEIASHGYNHIMCNEAAPDALLSDLIRSKHLIEDITGVEVKGYRAPSFSISNQALQLIERAGYSYDSSYNSFSMHGRYGLIQTGGRQKKGIAVRMTPGLYELPVSNLNLCGRVIPWGGGGYFRLLPFTLFKKGIEWILKQEQTYLFYIHPWEIDVEQPRVKQANGLHSFRHYLNLDKVYARMERMISSLSGCNFFSCKQYLEKMRLIQGVS